MKFYDVSNHISGMPIADLLGKINRVVKFTEDEKMTLNLKKYTEMRWLLTNSKEQICHPTVGSKWTRV
jgi:hypothetical protein